MNRRIGLAMVMVFIAIAAGAVAIIVERRNSLRNEAHAVFNEAKTFFDEHSYEKSASLLQSRRLDLLPWFSSPLQWNKLELSSAELDGDRLKVIAMYPAMPDLVGESEQCSLWLCRYFLSKSSIDEFDALRSSWKNKESIHHLWFNLDYDRLVAGEDFEGAKELLFSSKFEGDKDCGRLVRCAILVSQTDLKAALEYLAEAGKLSPKDPDIQLFRGQILEAVKDNKDAEFHYLAAFHASNKSAFYRSRLGDFYERRNQILKAIRIWDSGKEEIRPDYLSRKIHFWNKVVTGMAFPVSEAEKLGESADIPQYICNLPPSSFWDEEIFRKSGISLQAVRKSQELFWLRKIGFMKDGDDENLGLCLFDNPFSGSSFSENILNSLMLVNNFRRNGIMVGGKKGKAMGKVGNDARHSFFKELDACEYKFSMGEKVFLTPELEVLIRGPYAYSACLLAGGWFNGALHLANLDTLATLSSLPENLPVWYKYGITQAVNQVYGSVVALAFIGREKLEIRELQLLQGELLLSTGQVEEARLILSGLSGGNDDVAYRSMFLSTNLLASEKKLEAALTMITSNSNFAASETGLKLMARIYHSLGREAEAAESYRKLKVDSPEKLAYLVHYAKKTGSKSESEELMAQLGREFSTDFDARQYLLLPQIEKN